jgi:hypothetical protein
MSTTYTRGQFVQLDYNGQSVRAFIMLASSNSRSLMLGFAGALRTPSGGMMMGHIPLLMDDAGIYRDLVENAPATVTPVNDKKPVHH